MNIAPIVSRLRISPGSFAASPRGPGTPKPELPGIAKVIIPRITGNKSSEVR
jgi:hypothetical protein